jgi:hypothetical protein
MITITRYPAQITTLKMLTTLIEKVTVPKMLEMMKTTVQMTA